MEYLGDYCLKNQPAEVGLEDLRRQPLTQTLYSQDWESPQAKQ